MTKPQCNNLKANVSYNTEIQVPVNTLNNVYVSEGLKKVDILKIDTQGFEFEVLKGAKDILSYTLKLKQKLCFLIVTKTASFVNRKSFE